MTSRRSAAWASSFAASQASALAWRSADPARVHRRVEALDEVGRHLVRLGVVDPAEHPEVVVDERRDERRVVDVVEARRRLELEGVRQVVTLGSVDERVPGRPLGLERGDGRAGVRGPALAGCRRVLREQRVDLRRTGSPSARPEPMRRSQARSVSIERPSR